MSMRLNTVAMIMKFEGNLVQTLRQVDMLGPHSLQQGIGAAA